jgi:hypothetical protein
VTTRTWARRLFARSPRTIRKEPARFRPRLEALEDRLAPATLTVTSPADPATATPGTLRFALNTANKNASVGQSDTIVFRGVSTVTLSQGQLELSGHNATTAAAITIDGGGAVTVDGNNASRVFQVDAGVRAAFANLTIADGNADGNAGTFGGGGIYNIGGMVTVSGSTLSGNTADRSGFGGGGIFNDSGTLTVSGSTLSGNHADVGYGGGGIFNGGGGTVTVSGSTLSGNHADFGGGFGGGGIYNQGTVTVSGSTLSGNTADNGGGGIYNRGGTVTLVSAIVAGNTAPQGPDILGGVSAASSHNLVGDGTGLLGIGNGDAHGNQVGSSADPLGPRLSALGNYGGPTQTFALLPGSPAIAHGDDSLATPGATDQRGQPRSSGGHVDAGAFQSQGFTLAVVSGSPQSAAVNTAFAAPLVVRVTADHAGDPVDGGQVTFTAPGGGAAATLSPAGPVTIASGLASAAATANSAPGRYGVTASAGGNDVTTFALTNTATPAFSNLVSPTVVYGTASTTLRGHLAAGAFSPAAGAAVSITVNGRAQTAGLDGSGNFSLAFPTATLGVAGSPYAVTYRYAGDGIFDAASDGSTTLTVTQATPTITWPDPADIVYGTALGAAQLDATADVPGTFAYGPDAGAILRAGAHTLFVLFTPADTADYTSGLASVPLTVEKATPTVTWADPAAIVYGTALGGAQLDATADVPGTLAYSPGAGTVLAAGAQTLSAHFTPTDTIDYTTADAQVTLLVNQATPTITWAGPAAIVYGTPLGGAQLDATADVPGTFSYSPGAGAVLGAGSHTLSVTFTPADTADYTAASAGVTLVVDQATPTITWAGPADIVYGTALGAAQLDATADVPGTFSYGPGAGAVLGAGSHTLSATFTPADTADYTTATASVALTVAKATLTVTADGAARIYGVANPAFTAGYSGFVNGEDLASSGVTGSPGLSTDATPASLPGTYPITAAQGTLAAANYAFAFVGGTLTVNPDTLTGSGQNITTPVGAPFAGDVATFSDDNPNALAGDFTATITWGDGQTSAGAVRAAGGGFAVSGGHTYTSPGPFTLTVQLQATGVTPATFDGSAAVGSDAVIPGTGGNESLVLTRTAGGGAGAVTYALDGAAPVSLSGVTSFTFDGGAGDDTLTVGYDNGPPLLSGGIAFDGGAGVNYLVVDDSASAAATTLTVTDGQVTTSDGTATVAVRYRASGRIGSVEAVTGAAADTVLVQSTAAGATTAVLTGGGDNIYVSSAVGGGGTLDGLRGPLLIDARAGRNFLTVNDAGGSGPDTFTLTGSAVTDAAGLRIAYGASGGSFAGVNLATGPGAVRVNVQSTAAGAITGVLNMGGSDTIDVCSDTATNRGDLSGLKGTLLVEALGGTDLLVASEAGRQAGDDVVVTASALGSRDGAGFTIDYVAAGGGSFSGINFASGGGDDHITVQGAPAGVPVALYTMGGHDAVVVGVTPDSGYDLTVVGGPAGGTALGVADASGTAALDNVATGLDSGVVRALYAGRKPSTVTYRDVDQVFTSPPAG